MWNLSFKPPVVIAAEVFTALPQSLRRPIHSAWADANKAGAAVDCFLEGPCFDRAGNLYVTDIAHGRIFRISPGGDWAIAAEYDGWPNGLAIHADGRIYIADYKNGLMVCDPATHQVKTLLGHRNSESFRGVNDLTFDRRGSLYFTDQGQSGLHDPCGRVYRYDPDGRLVCLMANVPSPNGIALDVAEKALYVNVTRANAVWRGPLLPDGSLSKVGAFRTFFGTSGPDGMAVDEADGVVVAHASLGAAFVLNRRGEITHMVQSPAGHTVTNVAFRPGTAEVYMTESESGSVLRATLPAIGKPLYSHQAPKE